MLLRALLLDPMGGGGLARWGNRCGWIVGGGEGVDWGWGAGVGGRTDGVVITEAEAKAVGFV